MAERAALDDAGPPIEDLMEQCRMCDTPLEDGRIAAIGGRLRWLPAEAGGGMAASRCPSCRMGVFDYDADDELSPIRDAVAEHSSGRA